MPPELRMGRRRTTSLLAKTIVFRFSLTEVVGEHGETHLRLGPVRRNRFTPLKVGKLKGGAEPTGNPPPG